MHSTCPSPPDCASQEPASTAPAPSPQVYAWLGVEPPRGVLLHGPPGCGKTALANAIANECGVPFLRVSAPEIVSGMSGARAWARPSAPGLRPWWRSGTSCASHLVPARILHAHVLSKSRQRLEQRGAWPRGGRAWQCACNSVALISLLPLLLFAMPSSTVHPASSTEYCLLCCLTSGRRERGQAEDTVPGGSRLGTLHRIHWWVPTCLARCA